MPTMMYTAVVIWNIDHLVPPLEMLQEFLDSSPSTTKEAGDEGPRLARPIHNVISYSEFLNPLTL